MTKIVPERPHAAKILIHTEIHPVSNTNECMGCVVNHEVMKKFDINSSFIITIEGNDLEDCLKKTKEKLEKINEE